MLAEQEVVRAEAGQGEEEHVPHNGSFFSFVSHFVASRLVETQRVTRRVLNQRPERMAQVHAPSFIGARGVARGRNRGRKRE